MELLKAQHVNDLEAKNAEHSNAINALKAELDQG